VTAATRSGYKTVFAGLYDDVFRKVDGEWLIQERSAVAEDLPSDPDYSIVTSDPDVAEFVQPLLDALQRLGEPT